MKIPIHRIPRRSCKAKGRAHAVVVAYAEVDDDCVVLATKFWTMRRDGYAQTSEQGRSVLMHHAVLPGRVGFDVSHRNGNKLDNRRANLSLESRGTNMLNTADPLHTNNTSGFRGVTRDDKTRELARPWRGKVQIAGRTFQTPRFATPNEAAVALNDLRRSLGVPEDLRVREFPQTGGAR